MATSQSTQARSAALWEGSMAAATSVLQLQSAGQRAGVFGRDALLTPRPQVAMGLMDRPARRCSQYPAVAARLPSIPPLPEQNLGAAATAGGAPGDGSNAAALAAIGNNPNLVASIPDSTPVEAFSEITSNFGTVVQNANNDQQQSAASLQSLTQLKGSYHRSLAQRSADAADSVSELPEASGRAVQAANDITTFLVQNMN